MADGECLAMGLALEKEDSDLIALASDSLAAIQSVKNLARGPPPPLRHRDTEQETAPGKDSRDPLCPRSHRR